MDDAIRELRESSAHLERTIDNFGPDADGEWMDYDESLAAAIQRHNAAWETMREMLREQRPGASLGAIDNLIRATEEAS